MAAQGDVHRVLSEMYSLVTQKLLLPKEQQETQGFTAVVVEEIQSLHYSLENKLLLLTVVRRLIQNFDMYSNFCEALVARGLFTYLMEVISKAENLFLLYTCKETVATILVSPAVEKERSAYITLLCETFCKNTNSVSTKVTVAEICQLLLSSKPKLDCKMAIQEEILKQLYPSWLGLVEHMFSLCHRKPPAGDNYTYLINCFLKLWKKIVKVVHKGVGINQTSCVYLTSLDILVKEIRGMPCECRNSFVEILDAVFCQCNKTNSEMQAAVTCLALNLLNLDRTVIFEVMNYKTTGSFLGCRNTEEICDTTGAFVQGNMTCASSVLKIYISGCHIVSCQTGNTTEETLNTINLVCRCLKTMASYFRKPLHDVLVDCFQDQDDDYFQVSLDLLKIYLNLENVRRKTDESNSNKCEDICKDINPHHNFLLFSQNTDWDTSLLLDFIISPETCFLQYFTHYIKLITQDWHSFARICKQFSYKHRVSTNGSLNSESLKSTHSEVEDATSVNTVVIYTASSPARLPVLTGQTSMTTEDAANSTDCEGISTDTQSSKDHYIREASDQVSMNRQTPALPLVAYSYSSDEESASSEFDTGKVQGDNPRTAGDFISPEKHQALHCFTESPGETGSNRTVQEQQSNDVLERFMSSLIRLGLKLERMNKYDLLTFNIAPLIELINKCELLYEQ